MKKLLKIKTYFARHLSLQGYLWGGAQIFHTSERLSQWVNLFKSMADNFAILGQCDGQVTCHGLFRHGMCVNMWPNLTMQVFISNGGFIKLNVKWILSVFGQLNCPSLLTGYFYRMLENTEGCLGYFIKFNSCYGCCLERGNEEVEEHLLISLVLLHLMWLAPRSVLKRANYDYYDNIVSTTLTEMGLGVADQLGAM